MQKGNQKEELLRKRGVTVPANPKKVYILILNWNNWRDTIECLESVFQCIYPNFQVVCIDNASTDDSECIIKEWAKSRGSADNNFLASPINSKPISVISYDKKTAEQGGIPEQERALSSPDRRYPLIFIKSGGNRGYAGGNNVAIRYVMSKGDGAYLWILNNDTVVAEDALSAMVEDIEKDVEAGMVGSRLLYHDRTHIIQAAGGCRITPWLGNTRLIGNRQEDGPRWDRPFMPDYICGASLLVKKEVVNAIGLLDESYFLYWEDADWGMRARKEKYRLLYSPESRVRHKEGGTSGRISPSTDYYWTRNGLAFMKRFYPAFLPLAVIAYLLKHTLVRGVRRQPLNFVPFMRGVLDFFLGRNGK